VTTLVVNPKMDCGVKKVEKKAGKGRQMRKQVRKVENKAEKANT
jgi:hypothetical protein